VTEAGTAEGASLFQQLLAELMQQLEAAKEGVAAVIGSDGAAHDANDLPAYAVQVKVMEMAGTAVRDLVRGSRARPKRRRRPGVQDTSDAVPSIEGASQSGAGARAGPASHSKKSSSGSVGRTRSGTRPKSKSGPKSYGMSSK